MWQWPLNSFLHVCPSPLCLIQQPSDPDGTQVRSRSLPPETQWLPNLLTKETKPRNGWHGLQSSNPSITSCCHGGTSCPTPPQFLCCGHLATGAAQPHSGPSLQLWLPLENSLSAGPDTSSLGSLFKLSVLVTVPEIALSFLPPNSTPFPCSFLPSANAHLHVIIFLHFPYYLPLGCRR
jgi:hypothetical protein